MSVSISNVLSPLKKLGVTRINVSFSGSGDSGQIDGISYFSGEEDVTYDFVEKKIWEKGSYVTVQKPKYDLPSLGKKMTTKHEYVKEEKSWKLFDVEYDVTAEMIIEDFVYAQLTGYGVDWYNNEGGQGEFQLKLKPSGEWMYSVEIECNYMHSEVEYSEAGPLGSLEEDV